MAHTKTQGPRPVKNGPTPTGKEDRLVYRNLTRKGVVWSIKSTRPGEGPPELSYLVYMKDVSFKVSLKTQARIRKLKKRHVHAFVKGKVRQRIPLGLEWITVTYNPYKHRGFVCVKSGRTVASADYAVLDEKGLRVAGNIQWGEPKDPLSKAPIKGVKESS